MFTIGKLADATDTTADTIRFYEREGLLQPAGRSDSSYRLYDEDAVLRLRFIRHAQACGFTLSEVRDLLALRQREGACCGEVRAQALDKQRQLETKIRTLQAMSAALNRLIAGCNQAAEPVTACPILAAFDQVLMAQDLTPRRKP
jgi:MerR family Zn(II)-responsive transcriptional regulator of zntA